MSNVNVNINTEVHIPAAILQQLITLQKTYGYKNELAGGYKIKLEWELLEDSQEDRGSVTGESYKLTYKRGFGSGPILRKYWYGREIARIELKSFADLIPAEGAQSPSSFKNEVERHFRHFFGLPATSDYGARTAHLVTLGAGNGWIEGEVHTFRLDEQNRWHYQICSPTGMLWKGNGATLAEAVASTERDLFDKRKDQPLYNFPFLNNPPQSGDDDDNDRHSDYW